MIWLTDIRFTTTTTANNNKQHLSSVNNGQQEVSWSILRKPTGDAAHAQLEPDTLPVLLPAQPPVVDLTDDQPALVPAEQHLDNAEKLDLKLPPAEETRARRLFPNSFKVAGVKHVCDNLLSATLTGLPQLLGFIQTRSNKWKGQQQVNKQTI